MLAIAIALVPLAAAMIALVWLSRRGHSVRISKISLPFLQIDTNRFDDLSPVKMFSGLTAMCIPVHTSSDLLLKTIDQLQASPNMMIHAGWHTVCDAYITRFSSYPDDDSLKTNISWIGGQNMEFIIMFREIYISAVRQMGCIRGDTAAKYLVRAPSLAERISGSQYKRTDIPENVLEAASMMASGASNLSEKIIP